MAAAPTCATSKAAKLLPEHVAIAASMAQMDGARLVDAPPVQADGRRSRAPWWAAPPLLLARASAANTAATKVNDGSQATSARCTTFCRPTRRTAKMATASTHQDAIDTPATTSTAQTARSAPKRKRKKD